MTTDQPSPDEFSTLADLIGDEREFARRATDTDPRVRRRRRLRRSIIALVVILLLVGVPSGYTAWALTAPLAPPVATVQQPPPVLTAPDALAMPAEGASAISVSGGDVYLGPTASGIWTTSGSDEPRPIASITKLITALVVLDAKPLATADDAGPIITFDKAANDLYDKYYLMGATIAAMPTGTRMSQRDALAMMIIPSASNYAEAVSTWAYGSQSSFLRAARAWLAANGLTGTTIVEPTGISPENTSTPTDLIALGRLAASHPVIAKLASTSSLAIEGVGAFGNTNSLLGSSGVTGLKTGNLGEGAFTLLYSATIDVGADQPLGVIGVVLGGASRQSVDHDVVALLDSIRAGFHDVTVATRGQQIGTFTTPWGGSARMVLAKDASVFTWSDTPITMNVQTVTPKRYAQDEEIGSITWTAGPNSTTVPIVIEGTIAPPTDWWRLTHPSELGAG
ncbi:D-alanyl-D-alanine carboxypeptidase [Microbacterium sp. 4R-513]|uniref:D-alanyl-D-alanine carboxypeptidase family protein n=1 Tax=Microbacterium sp. 4R-513 TaxID=2567934 RepID=UPI0013E1397D|nr:D-alanyl-D-alanine carboxypeptidase [Microbacterium sp. 4R-513]QIG39651.1 D-alanyl-D-alanine carboxypeptidase [Microbacterium sp. 4R-513]